METAREQVKVWLAELERKRGGLTWRASWQYEIHGPVFLRPWLMISVTLLTSQDWELSQTNPILRYKVGKLKIHPCGSNYLFESSYTADHCIIRCQKGRQCLA